MIKKLLVRQLTGLATLADWLAMRIAHGPKRKTNTFGGCRHPDGCPHK